MILNQLNYVIFVVSTIFAISSGELNSDEDDSVVAPSRREFNLVKEMHRCTSMCRKKNWSDLVQKGYTFGEIDDTCRMACRKGLERAYGDLIQKQREQEGTKVEHGYYLPVLPGSSEKSKE